MFTGLEAPVTSCCKMMVNFCFTKEFNGRVKCLNELCHMQILDTFDMGSENRIKLFNEQQEDLKQPQPKLTKFKR